MKILSQILFFLSTSLSLLAQDCYKEAPLENLKLNYCDLWLNLTFQGTIGDDNQRIELRFIEVFQDNEIPSEYFVKGKSRVHNNVCDFEGVIIIDKIMLLEESNGGCEEPFMSDGILYGTYLFKENPNQKHVGQFKGDFKTMFDKKEQIFAVNTGSLGQEDFNCFIGTWQEYGRTESRYCAWGFHIPPSKRENLFKHYDNEFYLFNRMYIEKGWKPYVLSNLSVFIYVPLNFETNTSRTKDEFLKYSNEEIRQAIDIENNAWWK